MARRLSGSWSTVMMAWLLMKRGTKHWSPILRLSRACLQMFVAVARLLRSRQEKLRAVLECAAVRILHRPTGFDLVAAGDVDESVVDVRMIFRVIAADADE